MRLLKSGLTVAAVAAALWLTASPALAQERTDIGHALGETWSASQPGLDGGSGNISVNDVYAAYEYYNYGYISRTVTTKSGNESLYVLAYNNEPDFVQSLPPAEGGTATLLTRDQAYIYDLTLSGTQNFTATADQRSGCKTKIILSNLAGSYGTAFGKAVCNDAALAAIAQGNAAVIARVQALLGTKFDGTGFKIKGANLPHT